MSKESARKSPKDKGKGEGKGKSKGKDLKRQKNCKRMGKEKVKKKG